MTDSAEHEILYGRDQDALRIFVSSQMSGNVLAVERRVAADTINDTPMHRAWCWEDNARAGAYHSEAECVRFAAASDGIVLLLGQRLTRITRAEYQAASQNGADRFIFVRNGESRTRQASQFIRRERRTAAITRNFANLSELRSHIVESLLASAVRASRQAVVNRRRVLAGTTIPAAGPTPSASR